MLAHLVGLVVQGHAHDGLITAGADEGLEIGGTSSLRDRVRAGGQGGAGYYASADEGLEFGGAPRFQARVGLAEGVRRWKRPLRWCSSSPYACTLPLPNIIR